MPTKTQRHHVILALLDAVVVDSQEQLQRLLAGEGFDVNQATLSRDLRALGVVKAPLADGGARYRRSVRDARVSADTALAVANLRAFLAEIEASGNLLVCKTRVGCAQPVGLALDQLKLEGIAGTLAGDDTLLTVVREGYKPADVMASIWDVVAQGADAGESA